MGLGLWDGADSSGIRGCVITSGEEEEAAYRDWDLGSQMAFSFSTSLSSL